MAHFAKIDSNNIVTQVIVITDEQEHRGQEFINQDLGLEGTWLKTSYNTFQNKHKIGGTPYRGNYAGIGFTYDPENDVFLEPKPYPSWTLSTERWRWEPPVPKPVITRTVVENEVTIGVGHKWNEETLTWDELPTE
jgi:hypothetical protein